MRARSLSAILVACAVLLGGCGGDDAKNEADVRIESKADYIKAGDKICHDRDERSLKLAKGSNEGNIADLTGELAEIYSEAINRQQALDLPKGGARAGAQRYAESVKAMARPVARMKSSADALAGAKADEAIKQAAATLQENVNTVQAIGDLADQQARRYGFKVCGKQQAQNPVA